MDLLPATPGAIRAVALAMRDRDFAELTAVLPYEHRDELATYLCVAFGQRGMLCASLDGRPVCIGGAVSVRPGSATLLFFATDAFPSIAKPMTRFIRKRFFSELADAGVHRIECVSLSAYGEMHRWLRTLGLKHEGTFKAYGRNREDFAQFARVI